MFKAFAYGIISACGTTVFQQFMLLILGLEIIDTSRLSYPLIFGAISEEIFKLLFILQLKKEKTEKLFFQALMVGLGFSLLEVTFKIWSAWEEGAFIWKGYLGVILIHVLTSGIIGFFLEKKWNFTFKISIGLLIALTIHLAYNASQIYLF